MLKENTDLTRQIHELTLQLHEKVLGPGAASAGD
jgi:hypothetical protein